MAEQETAVCYLNGKSCWQDTKTGITQGSILLWTSSFLYLFEWFSKVILKLYVSACWQYWDYMIHFSIGGSYTELVPSLRDGSYIDWLTILNLPSLYIGTDVVTANISIQTVKWLFWARLF